MPKDQSQRICCKLYKSFIALLRLPTSQTCYLLPLVQEAIFGSKQGKVPQAQKFSLCLWNITPHQLLQPDPSRYSEALGRKCADESFRTIDSIEDSASSVDILHSFDRFATERDHQKGEDPSNHKLDIEFIVQLLVHVRSIAFGRHDACRCHSSLAYKGLRMVNPNQISHPSRSG